jgi:hypothetical protein
MTVVDSRGRLFGRINLFDAAIVGFVIVLIPIAYGTFLLFRTPKPSVTSVRIVGIAKEERRVGGPGLTAKLKVRGSGLRPLLRAFIDDIPAIGFIFENPNSADVLVGAVPAGPHDLILYDGVQEVARAVHAVNIQPTPPARLRIVGTIVGLDRATADSLQAGASSPRESEFRSEILRLGPVRPDSRRLRVGAGEIDLPLEGAWARDVVIRVQCDLDPTVEECSVGGKALSATPPPVVTISGPMATLNVAVGEILPDTAPREARLRVRFEGNPELIDLIKSGDRDLLLDERVATVAEVGRRQGAGGGTTLDVTLRLGADAIADGWRYRGHTIKPGEPFTLSTARYAATGAILGLSFGENDAPTVERP